MLVLAQATRCSAFAKWEAAAGRHLDTCERIQREAFRWPFLEELLEDFLLQGWTPFLCAAAATLNMKSPLFESRSA